MPSSNQWVAFLVASILFIQVPGPSVLFMLGRALTVGRRDALMSVAGNGLGLIVQAMLVAVGLGAVVAASATAYSVLKLVGAAYVVYLGVQAIRHRGDARRALLEGRTAPTEGRRALLHRAGRRAHQPEDDRVLRGVPAAVHRRDRRRRAADRRCSA